MKHYLDFEKPIEELENKIEELRGISYGQDASLRKELDALESKAASKREEIFSNLTPWQKTQLARHPGRPYTTDYIELMTEDFVELHGDRRYADDPALVGGPCKIGQRSVMLIGHQKGRGVKKRIKRNFGQPNPEGYRKALRLMKTAERFKMPVVTLIDTPGAYPGIGAEERGQAEAIAVNLMEMSSLKVPIVAIVIGEGGSGGALAISVSDRLFMLEYSVFSVISPEGCAAILWKKDGELTQTEFSQAAGALKITAEDLTGFGISDGVIPEPMGGAHQGPEATAQVIKEYVTEALEELVQMPIDTLLEQRYEKLRQIGGFVERDIVPKQSP